MHHAYEAFLSHPRELAKEITRLYDKILRNEELSSSEKEFFSVIKRIGLSERYLQDLLNVVSLPNDILDPFGCGDPPIDYKIVKEISMSPNTDMLFSYMCGVRRPMGFARKYIESPNMTKRSQARSMKEAFDIFWGSGEWFKWGKLPTLEYAKRYASGLKEGKKVEIIEIPFQSKNPAYFLIFVTQFKTPKWPFRLS